MKEQYLKAIQKIKELQEIITETEWNKIAKENNLLSSESIKYISQKDFMILQEELRTI